MSSAHVNKIIAEVSYAGMAESTQKVYALRLTPGQEVTTKLQDFLRENKLEAAYVITCVGSVTSVKLRMAGGIQIKTFHTGPYEIVSLVGTLSAGAHLHATFSDDDGHVFGGHVVDDMKVFTTAEIIIGECSDLKFTRELDEQTGYNELVVNKK